MADPFVGEIMIAGFNFAPANYAIANGALVPIRQYTALFSLIGTAFGGNGTVTFALPDLAATAPCGAGEGPGRTPRTVGEQFGSASVSLTQAEMPAHTHIFSAYYGRGVQETSVPTNTTALGTTSQKQVYGTETPNAQMAPLAILPSGAGVPHENRQPYLGVNYCIAMNGTYPPFD